jgi:hypothetical protein
MNKMKQMILKDNNRKQMERTHNRIILMEMYLSMQVIKILKYMQIFFKANALENLCITMKTVSRI